VSSVAQLSDFPFVADLPKREKGKVAKLMDVMEELERVTDEKGPVIPQSLIAEVLGVSKQRVNTLLDEGRMEFHVINGTRFVFVASFREYAKQERKVGRPSKASLLARAAYGLKLGSSFGAEVASAAWDKPKNR